MLGQPEATKISACFFGNKTVGCSTVTREEKFDLKILLIDAVLLGVNSMSVLFLGLLTAYGAGWVGLISFIVVGILGILSFRRFLKKYREITND